MHGNVLQAIDVDPADATLLSNRSLCWIRLGQAELALDDAKACRALRPDWAKACYREGAALRLLQACSFGLVYILFSLHSEVEEEKCVLYHLTSYFLYSFFIAEV